MGSHAGGFRCQAPVELRSGENTDNQPFSYSLPPPRPRAHKGLEFPAKGRIVGGDKVHTKGAPRV